jgi:hypothetical protein
LLWVRPASIEDNPHDESVTTDIPRVYLKALSMIEFDPFLVTHATATKVDVQVSKAVKFFDGLSNLFKHELSN